MTPTPSTDKTVAEAMRLASAYATVIVHFALFHAASPGDGTKTKEARAALESFLRTALDAPAESAAMPEGQQMVADCAPYLKDGETPIQRIERAHRDIETILNLLVREKQKNEALIEEISQVNDEMVSRFLGWPLPKTFAPDCGISFDGRKDDEWNKGKTWPIGTNLFTSDEARAMLTHVLAPTAVKTKGKDDSPSRTAFMALTATKKSCCGGHLSWATSAASAPPNWAMGRLKPSSR